MNFTPGTQALRAGAAVLGCAALDAPDTHITPTSPSSRGPGHRPFTAVTRVRISVGTPPNLPDLLQFRFSSAFVAPLLPRPDRAARATGSPG